MLQRQRAGSFFCRGDPPLSRLPAKRKTSKARWRIHVQEIIADIAVDGRDQRRCCTVGSRLGSRRGAQRRVEGGSDQEVHQQRSTSSGWPNCPWSPTTAASRALQATKPQARARRSTRTAPASSTTRRFLESRHDAVLAAVGGGKKALQLRLRVQRLRRRTDRRAGSQAARDAGRARRDKDEAHAARHVVDAGVPRPDAVPAASGPDRRQGRGRHHRHRRRRRLAGAPELLRPHRRQRQRARKDGKLGYQQIPGWHGRCVPGEQFTAIELQPEADRRAVLQRRLGRQRGHRRPAALGIQLAARLRRPRHAHGHDRGRQRQRAGHRARRPCSAAISGIAPRARIAAYKVCWETGRPAAAASAPTASRRSTRPSPTASTSSTSRSAARTTNFRDSVEIAFLFAADAGVFVAASAGNSGPTTQHGRASGPVADHGGRGHAQPQRRGLGDAGQRRDLHRRVGGNAGRSGAADRLDGGRPAGRRSDAGRAVLWRGRRRHAVLDPAKVAGKIVVCERGVTARVNKSLAVQQAGGVGMVLFNSPRQLAQRRLPLRADRARQPGRAARPSRPMRQRRAPRRRSTRRRSSTTRRRRSPRRFSSRGPLRAGNGDLLKPDLIAPGQDILAARGASGQCRPRLSTSTAARRCRARTWPASRALLKEPAPGLVADDDQVGADDDRRTTCSTDGPNTNPLVIFRQGAGHVKPNCAADPGLVFDSGFNDWLNFICGTQPGSFCSAFTPIDPSNLNVASIAIGDMAGTQTVTRKVTNVGGAPADLHASSYRPGGHQRGGQPGRADAGQGRDEVVHRDVHRRRAQR